MMCQHQKDVLGPPQPQPAAWDPSVFTHREPSWGMCRNRPPAYKLTEDHVI